MPMMPAICNTCGTVFPSSCYAENSQISFSGCIAGPCPNCGNMGRIPDGVYNFMGDVIQILSAPQRTIEELTRFAEILRSAQRNNTTPEDLEEEIQQETPELSPLLKLLTNQHFQYWLTTILTIIQMIQGQMDDEPKDKPENHITINQTIEVNQVINNIYQENTNAPIVNQQNNSNPALSQSTGREQIINLPIRSEKIGRNELCPCGSGSKYKRCHGQ